jgi:hypothetical protein
MKKTNKANAKKVSFRRDSSKKMQGGIKTGVKAGGVDPSVLYAWDQQRYGG